MNARESESDSVPVDRPDPDAIEARCRHCGQRIYNSDGAWLHYKTLMRWCYTASDMTAERA